MLFRKKAVIEAVRITEEWFKGGEVLVDMITGVSPIPNGVVVDSTNKKVIVKGDPAAHKQYSREAVLGEWIILGPKMYVMSDAEFKALYVPIDEGGKSDMGDVSRMTDIQVAQAPMEEGVRGKEA